MLRISVSITIALLLFHLPAQCWWENGHRTTARIAAYYLTPAAQAHVAAILGVPNDPASVADALAQASTWADEIKKDRPETANWHFVDLTLQDTKANIADRCPDQNCATARIDLFYRQLMNDKAAADPTMDVEALKFLVHFVGDIHQPLHASSDADLGGNCEPLEPAYEQAKNLHALWDGPLVDDINTDDKQLAAELKPVLDGFGEKHRSQIMQGSPEDWAWESHKTAIRVIYKRLHVPEEPVEFPNSCKTAPEAILEDRIEVQTEYVDAMKVIVKQQLERGGLRLAKLLNSISAPATPAQPTSE